MKDLTFDDFFYQATGHQPYPYQRGLATCQFLPQVLDIPTGLGKTAGNIVSWLWRRFTGLAVRGRTPNRLRCETPRRLVYCLPMRVLVSQTVSVANNWVQNLEQSKLLTPDRVKVYTLIGGEIDRDWDYWPEQEAIIVGTQDQLLSRALNRGYAMTRFRWPTHFGLLNNDCLWVMDEVQLMGVGMLTTAQLQAFRSQFLTYGPTHSIWSSATLDENKLITVDHKKPEAGWNRLSLSQKEQKLPEVVKRLRAKKSLKRANTLLTHDEKTYAKELAQEIISAHVKGTLTLVVVNRVSRAQAVYEAVLKAGRKDKTAIIHSRFREWDRKAHEEVLFATGEDRIVIATQTIEAGIDVSARTLFTELCPWFALVQRLGRLNRYGEYPEAVAFWIDIPTEHNLTCMLMTKDSTLNEKKAKTKAENILIKELPPPYGHDSLAKTKVILDRLDDGSPSSLAKQKWQESPTIMPVIRRKDMLDLFDTTPDLMGNDIDVSRYIRDSENNDVQVFWLDFDGTPSKERSVPRREELCSVHLVAFKKFLKKNDAWRWDHLSGMWVKVSEREIFPGLTLLLNSRSGGYNAKLGWTGELARKPVTVPPVPITEELLGFENEMNEKPTGYRWILLTDHSKNVSQYCRDLASNLGLNTELIHTLEIGGRYHDVGKAHEEGFQSIMSELEGYQKEFLWAKAPRRNRDYIIKRNCFRHELASALAWLQQCSDNSPLKDLVAYLIASHHGKIRMSIRSYPKEAVPPGDNRLFACGVWDQDTLPEVDLGDGHKSLSLKLDMSPIKMGDGAGGPSWLSRTQKLVQEFGPFRLAYLESLLRIADWRVSIKERGGDE